jgi:hypothetical protein
MQVILLHSTTIKDSNSLTFGSVANVRILAHSASLRFGQLPVVLANLLHLIRSFLVQAGAVLELALLLGDSFGMLYRQLLASMICAQLTGWLIALRTLDEVHGVRVEHAADGCHALL